MKFVKSFKGDKLRTKEKKIKRVKKYDSLEKILEDRTGGAIALKGFEYQQLYSCYIALEILDKENDFVHLEGIEDVDTFKSNLSQGEEINHIQLKYSERNPDASFMNSILKNYLEVYLLDKNRYFKLVYNFEPSKGNLKELFSGELKGKSKKFWENKILSIMEENSTLEWGEFNTEDFLNKLKFERLRREELEEKITEKVIDKYEINEGNEKLYINSLLVFFNEKMKEGELIGLVDVQEVLLETKDSINRGTQNPSYRWVDRIEFINEKVKNVELIEKAYYSGKKASSIDIINKLPVRREIHEKKIQESLNENIISVIKASSGQGKTTLAWQVAYNLKDDYEVYSLSQLDKKNQINDTIEYFKSRIKVGRKILIILDNLNINFKEWNSLAEQLYSEIGINYRMLITTREDDWYSYSGDQSNLRQLKIIDIYLDQNEAKDIYERLREKKQICNTVNNWHPCWEAISNKGLMIEYIYLLTQGKMIKERIADQIKIIKDDNLKLRILELIALADVLEIKLPLKSLIEKLHKENLPGNIKVALEGIENEFHISIKEENQYIEGLHPVRSNHLLEELLYEEEKDIKILDLLEIVDKKYIAKLYSELPGISISNKEAFYMKLVERTEEEEYSYYVEAIKGLFSGEAKKFYLINQEKLDQSNEYSGLSLVVFEKNPFRFFPEVDEKIETLDSLAKINKTENIEKLLGIANSIDELDLRKSDLYIYVYYLCKNLKNTDLRLNIQDYGDLAYWMFRINNSFNMVLNLDFNEIWEGRKNWDPENLGNLFYILYTSNQNKYFQFFNSKEKDILNYLKIINNSLKVDLKDGKELFIEFLLSSTKYDKANEEGVKRIELACKFLPHLEKYNSKALLPQIDILEKFILDKEKKMPKRNIVITFNKNFAKLWNDSVLSNYEFSSIYDWLVFWIEVRSDIVKFSKLYIRVLEKKINRRIIAQPEIDEVNVVFLKVLQVLKKEGYFPYSKRPFLKEEVILEEFQEIENNYLRSITNFINQCFNVFNISTEINKELPLYNIKDAVKSLNNMQNFFNKIISKQGIKIEKYSLLVEDEKKILTQLSNLLGYFLESNNQTAVNRNLINSWKKQKEQSLITEIKRSLNDKALFEIILPSKSDITGVREELTIVLRGFNSFEETHWKKLLEDLGSVKGKDICLNILIGDNKELESAFRINFSRYDEINSLEDILEKIIPLELCEELLGEFSNDFTIKKLIFPNELWTIYLKLWEYSSYMASFDESEKEEKEYFLIQMNNLREEIEESYDKTKDSLDYESKEIIEEIKKEVFLKKEYLTDELLEQCYTYLISKNYIQ